MAQVVETEEPVVRERETQVVREERPRSGVGTILLILLVIIILALLFWRPWSGGGSSTTNVNVPTPTVNTKP